MPKQIQLSKLTSNIKYCNSLISQIFGLMFTKKTNHPTLIFKFKKPKQIQLHMFFVFYPIDVLFLNEKKEIIETKENFKPFTFYTSKNKAKYIIELPNKSIKKNNISIKDIILSNNNKEF